MILLYYLASAVKPCIFYLLHMDQDETVKKILVLLPVNNEHKSYLQRCLGDGARQYEFVFTNGAEPSEDQLNDASILLGCRIPDYVRKSGKLEWIQASASGVDNYLAPGVLPEGVSLSSAAGAYGTSVSEHMLALTLDLIKKMNQYSVNQKKRIWEDLGPIKAIEGSTVAVLGLGDIGSSYARKMKALGAAVIGLRRTVGEKPGYIDELYSINELEAVLPRADIVAMALPGGSKTRHIINEKNLKLMKKGAFIINAGRGNAIDPAALKSALKEGTLGGAALDVTEPEPLPEDDELWGFDNAIITPHVAGKLRIPQNLELIVQICGENLSRWIKGEPLRNQII